MLQNYNEELKGYDGFVVFLKVCLNKAKPEPSCPSLIFPSMAFQSRASSWAEWPSLGPLIIMKLVNKKVKGSNVFYFSLLVKVILFLLFNFNSLKLY